MKFSIYKCDDNEPHSSLLQGHIKLKEAALETSANSFLEKEKDLQVKIEELERHVEEFIQSSARQLVSCMFFP